jgi:hypothetical protein
MGARAAFILVAALSAGTASAELPDPAQFAAGIESGHVDLQTFDFAAAGFWDAPPEKRWSWFAAVQALVNLDPNAHAGCDAASQRKNAAAAWFIPVPLSQSSEDWKATVSALRDRIRRVDAELEGAARSAEQQVSKNPLLSELRRRLALDQKIRELSRQPPPKDFPSAAVLPWSAVLSTRWAAIDCGNTEWLKNQLKEIGWFDIPTYGAEADESAWYLVQHADREPAFQRAMLAHLQALPATHTSQKRIAYLWDRVAGQDGKPQRYGTQGMCLPDGSWRPLPTEDPEHLDERRVSLGMEPIAEHAGLVARESCPLSEAK